jgi:c-di-GMP-binding flagellar brake protein YcgR
VFFFNKKKRHEPKPVRPPIPSTGQKRSAFRMPVGFDVHYTLDGRRGRRSAYANDLSAGGLRLSCDEDFLKGSAVLVQFLLPDDFLAEMTVEREVYEQSPFGMRPETVRVKPPPFPPMTMRAKVMASFFSVEQRRFAHGIAFVDIEPKMQEELQRFIHLWQLHHLRTRRGDLG